MEVIMRLRVISDGTVKGTHLETEDGEEIEGVVSLVWEIDAHGGPEISFTRVSLLGVSADLIGEIEEEL
jgi:hypothetical protein